jgi:hypothetical protein
MAGGGMTDIQKKILGKNITPGGNINFKRYADMNFSAITPDTYKGLGEGDWLSGILEKNTPTDDTEKKRYIALASVWLKATAENGSRNDTKMDNILNLATKHIDKIGAGMNGGFLIFNKMPKISKNMRTNLEGLGISLDDIKIVVGAAAEVTNDTLNDNMKGTLGEINGLESFRLPVWTAILEDNIDLIYKKLTNYGWSPPNNEGLLRIDATAIAANKGVVRTALTPGSEGVFREDGTVGTGINRDQVVDNVIYLYMNLKKMVDYKQKSVAVKLHELIIKFMVKVFTMGRVGFGDTERGSIGKVNGNLAKNKVLSFDIPSPLLKKVVDAKDLTETTNEDEGETTNEDEGETTNEDEGEDEGEGENEGEDESSNEGAAGETTNGTHGTADAVDAIQPNGDMKQYFNPDATTNSTRSNRDEIVAHIQLMTDPNYQFVSHSKNTAATYTNQIGKYSPNQEQYKVYYNWLEQIATHHGKMIDGMVLDVHKQIIYTMKFPEIDRVFKMLLTVMDILSRCREIETTHKTKPHESVSTPEERGNFRTFKRKVEEDIGEIRGMAKNVCGWVEDAVKGPVPVSVDTLVRALGVMDHTSLDGVTKRMDDTNNTFAEVMRLSSYQERANASVGIARDKAVTGATAVKDGVKGVASKIASKTPNLGIGKKLGNVYNKTKGLVTKVYIRPDQWEEKFVKIRIYDGNKGSKYDMLIEGCEQWIDLLQGTSAPTPDNALTEQVRDLKDIFIMNQKMWKCKSSPTGSCDLQVTNADLDRRYGLKPLQNLVGELMSRIGASGLNDDFEQEMGIISNITFTQIGGGGVSDKAVGWLNQHKDVVALISTLFADAAIEKILDEDKNITTPENLADLYQYFMPSGQMVGAPYGTEQMIQDFVEFYQIMKQIGDNYKINITGNDETSDPELDNNIIPHLIARMAGGNGHIPSVPENTKSMIDRIMRKVDDEKRKTEEAEIGAAAVVDEVKIDAKPAKKAEKAKKVSKPGIFSTFMSGTNAPSSFEHIDGNKSLKIRVKNDSLIIDIANEDANGVVILPLESVFNSKHLTANPPQRLVFDAWAVNFLVKHGVKSEVKSEAKSVEGEAKSVEGEEEEKDEEEEDEEEGAKTIP